MLGRNALNIAAIPLAIVLFLSITVIANTALKTVSLDLTEDRIYTLSDGTREILEGIEEPIVLRYYVSPLLKDEVPRLSTYATRVQELLERYVEIAAGGLVLEVQFLELFSPDEDRAVAFGLQSIPVNVEGDPAFLGLAATNSTDDLEVIPFFAPDREGSLEYDLTKLIGNLANPEKRSVALVGSLPLASDPAFQNRPWLIHDQISEFFDLRTHPGVFSAIDAEFDVLMIALPDALGDKELYAIDQYVLGGGSALIFVDPFPEMSQRSRGWEPGDRGLEPLFTAWGLDVDLGHVVGDRLSAQRVRVQSGGRQRAVDYLPWLALRPQALNGDDVVTRDLAHLNMASAGVIERRDDADVSLSPLIASSPESMRIGIDRVRYRPDPIGLMNEFVSEGQSLTIATRLSGNVGTAFPDGPPRDDDGSVPETLREREHRAASVEPINVIVVADTDILYDNLWANAEDVSGQRLVTPFAANAQFVINALDNLSGSSGLINLRSRGLSSRPFKRLEAIARDAETRYRAKEQELNEKLAATESKIRDIRVDASDTVILSREEFEAMQEFRAEAATTRQELRQVQLALRQDIERAETWIKAINIGAIPLIVGILAIVLAVIRRLRMNRRYERDMVAP